MIRLTRQKRDILNCIGYEKKSSSDIAEITGRTINGVNKTLTSMINADVIKRSYTPDGKPLYSVIPTGEQKAMLDGMRASAELEKLKNTCPYLLLEKLIINARRSDTVTRQEFNELASFITRFK